MATEPYDAGAGRGKQGGPTAEELRAYNLEQDIKGNVWSPERFPGQKEAPRDVMPGDVKKPKKYAKGGSVSSASKRADGATQRGKTKGRFV